MWATPILWDKTTIPNIPGWFDHILKLNPLYYVVQGLSLIHIYLHNWKHTDLKYNLLYQVTVFQQTI